MITLPYELNLYPASTPITVHVSQYDSDFSIVFTLVNTHGTFTLESGTTAEIRGTKKDGNGYSKSATINISAKTVTVQGDEQMTAVAGANTYELALLKGSKVLHTANFVLMVERAALDADTIQSETVLKELSAIIAGAAEATQAAEDASDAADRAEAAAQTLEIDATLTHSGQAADAKAVGDEISELKDDFYDISEIETVTVDKSTVTKLSAYVSGSGNIGSNNDCKLIYVGCLPSTTYTINKVLSTRFRVGYTAVTPAIGGTVSGLIENNDGTTIVITAGESAQYLVIYYYDGANDTLTESSIYDSLAITYRTDITAVDKVARNEKVDKQQAVADAGKVLAIDDSGIVVPTEFSGGLSNEAKEALLACFAKVAWIDEHGQDYYDNLYEALYEEPYVPEWGNDYTWLYRADSGELFSVNENVSSFTIDTGATEELVGNTLHLSSVCTGGEPAVRYHLSPTTNTVGRLTVKAKFNSIPKLTGGGGGMRMQISGGSSGARLMQKHDPTDNKYYVSVRAGSQGQNVAEIQLNTWYILAVELDNGVQKLYIDGTLVFTSSSLNSYATDNQLFVQAPQDQSAGNMDVNIAWITYKNGDVTS